MLTAHQAETVAYSTEHGSIYCPQCLDPTPDNPITGAYSRYCADTYAGEEQAHDELGHAYDMAEALDAFTMLTYAPEEETPDGDEPEIRSTEIDAVIADITEALPFLEDYEDDVSEAIRESIERAQNLRATWLEVRSSVSDDAEAILERATWNVDPYDAGYGLRCEDCHELIQ